MLAQRGGAFYSEAALQLLDALWSDTGGVQVVDVRNEGTLAGLPERAVIEVPCHIHRDGATPAQISPLPTAQTGLAAHVAAYEELTVEAAVSGDTETAFLALLAHPLVGQSSLAEQLLADLLAANVAHLPRFAL